MAATPSQTSAPVAELPQDRKLFERALVQLRELAQELERLARENVPQHDFCGQFVERLISGMAAVGGAIWLTDGEGTLRLAFQQGCEGQIDALPGAAAAHERILNAVLSQDKGCLVEAGTALAGYPEAINLSDCLLVATPIKSDGRVRGVVEVLQTRAASPSTRRGYLQFLNQMASIAAEFFRNAESRELQSQRELWKNVGAFAQSIYASLNVRETAFAVANEGRRLIQCDRLSVAVVRNGHCRIESISGQETFDSRANSVRMLEEISQGVVEAGHPMSLIAERSDFSPELQPVVAEYVTASHSRFLSVLPLWESSGDGPSDKRASRPFGALLIEQLGADGRTEVMSQRVPIVHAHASQALARALDHNGSFLIPWCRKLERLAESRTAEQMQRTSVRAGVIAGVLLVAALIPVNFRLEGRGVLQPAERRNVFAQVDGIVERVIVRHGDTVRAGQTLLEIRNSDLELRTAAVRGELAATKERLAAVRTALLSDKRLPTSQRDLLHGNEEQLARTCAGLEAQLRLHEEQQAHLHVVSPISGRVVTWDPQALLGQRSVSRGQVLLSVAAVDGPWELDVRMLEDRAGCVARAAHDRSDGLDVDFVLVATPGESFSGKVVEIHDRAESNTNSERTVRLRVAVDPEKIPNSYVGAAVQARVSCGWQPAGFVWFHDAIRFVQSQILFRL